MHVCAFALAFGGRQHGIVEDGDAYYRKGLKSPSWNKMEEHAIEDKHKHYDRSFRGEPAFVYTSSSRVNPISQPIQSVKSTM